MARGDDFSVSACQIGCDIQNRVVPHPCRVGVVDAANKQVKPYTHPIPRFQLFPVYRVTYHCKTAVRKEVQLLLPFYHWQRVEDMLEDRDRLAAAGEVTRMAVGDIGLVDRQREDVHGRDDHRRARREVGGQEQQKQGAG